MSPYQCLTVRRPFFALITKNKGKEFIMPKTKIEEFIFTLLTSGVMIFIMGVYNIAVSNGGLEYSAFYHETRAFALEWIIGFLFAFFIGGKIAKHFAFKVVEYDDRPMLIILTIQCFTVCAMVPFMSMVGVIRNEGITFDLPLNWLQTVVINFIMALPLQLFAAGPLCRKIFRLIMVIREKSSKLQNVCN